MRTMQEERYERPSGSYSVEFTDVLKKAIGIPTPITYVNTGPDWADAVLETGQWYQQLCMSVALFNPLYSLTSMPGMIGLGPVGNLDKYVDFVPLKAAIGRLRALDGKLRRYVPSVSGTTDSSGTGDFKLNAIDGESIYSGFEEAEKDALLRNYSAHFLDEDTMLNHERYFASLKLKRADNSKPLAAAIIDFTERFQRVPVENSRVLVKNTSTYMEMNPQAKQFKEFTRTSVLLIEGVPAADFLNPVIINALKHANEVLRYCDGRIFIFGQSDNYLPEELRSLIPAYDFPPPTEDERRFILRSVQASLAVGTEQPASLENEEALLKASNGLSRTELRRGAKVAIATQNELRPEAISAMRRARLKEGYGLQWHDPSPDFTFESLGGFDGLKTFCRRMWKDNTSDLRPKSLLTLGIPGVGKSMFCKALGSELGLDTVIFNMDGVLNSLIGSSENNLRRTLDLLDKLGSIVIVLDEFEKLLGGQGAGERDGGTSSRLLAIFLKWMQDKSSDSIVVATCNGVEQLPVESLRAGRFDSLWFLDLPPACVQTDIARHYIRKYGYNRSTHGVELTDDALRGIIYERMAGWSGAEIELAVKYATIQNLPLPEGLRYVTPVVNSSRAKVEALREHVKAAFLCGYTGRQYDREILENYQTS